MHKLDKVALNRFLLELQGLLSCMRMRLASHAPSLAYVKETTLGFSFCHCIAEQDDSSKYFAH